MIPERKRFEASATGLALNSWGVWDKLAKCYAVRACLSRANAEARAAAMNNAARGRGR